MGSNVSPALLNFPIVDASGRPTAQFFQAWQSLVSGAQPTAWKPTLAGSSAAGANHYAVQWGAVCPIGQFELCLFSLTLSALDAAMAGEAEIATLPSTVSASGGLTAGWISEWGGITLSAGYTMLGLSAAPGATGAVLMQSGSGMPAAPLPASALSAAAHVTGGLFYQT